MEEEFASQFLRDHTIMEVQDEEDEAPSDPTPSTSKTTDSAKKARTLRNGIFRAASLQDKLLEK